MSRFRNLAYSCARIAAFISILALSALAAQAQVVFSPPKNISNSSGNTQNQQIAVDAKGNINVVWLDNGSGTNAVLFSRSSDGGMTFSTPQNLSSQAGSSAFLPEMALDSAGNVYILWSDNSSGNGGVFLTRSTDGGADFSVPQIISHAGANPAGDQLVVDSNSNINVAWSDNSPGYYAVFFSRSTDGGATFSATLQVSTNASVSSFIAGAIVDSSGNINIAWVDRGSSGFFPFTDFLLSRSVDGGATFSAPNVIDSETGSPFHPVLTVSDVEFETDRNGNINLLWSHPNFNGDWFDFGVLFSRSADGGLSFSSPKTIGSNSGNSPLPTMAIGPSGDVNVIFENNPDFPFFLETGITDNLTRSVDGGATFARAWNSDTCGDANGAAAVATEASGRISVAYGFFGGPACPGGGLLFTQSADGSNFSTPQNVSGNSSSASPVITTDSGGSIYAVWEEILSPQTSRNQNVFFSRSVALSSVTLSLVDLTGGSSSTGTVALNGPAPTGGAVVSLSSSDPSVSVPASVTVAEGATSATFPVTTSAVSATTKVTISATFNGITQNSSLTVRLVYNFIGYLAPLLNDGSALFHSGRTVPVKFQLTAPDGSIVTNALANIQVLQIQNTPSGTVEQDMGATASGGSSSGTAFRFDPTSNQYIFNLDTTGYGSGTYLLRTTISDRSTHVVQFSIQ